MRRAAIVAMLVGLLLGLTPPASRACCVSHQSNLHSCCTPQNFVRASYCAQSSVPALREDGVRLASQSDLALAASFLREQGISVQVAGGKSFSIDKARPRPPGVLRI
jgi:hypothetical protein